MTSTLRPATPDEMAALAPTGALRVALNVGTPISFLPGSGDQPAGVLHDLARELAAQLGVPFEPMLFHSIPEVLAAMKSGEADVTGTNATPARSVDIAYTGTVVEMELGYLVPAGSRLRSAEEVAAPGVRVGVMQGSTSQKVMPGRLPEAVVVPVPGLEAAGRMLQEGVIDAFTTNKPALFEIVDAVPGLHVLPGGWGQEQWAMGVPRHRAGGLGYLEDFLVLARERGSVEAAMRRAGLRGASASVAGTTNKR